MLKNTTHSPLKAVLFVISAGFFFTSMAVLAKLAMQTQSVVEVVFFRNLVAALCLFVPMLARGKVSTLFITKRPWMLTFRAAAGLAGLMLNFWAVKLLPLAEQTALFFSYPVMLTLLSTPLLGERLSWRRALGAGLGFLGVLIIANPSGQLSALGVAIALSGAFFTALVGVTLRSLSLSEPNTRIVFWFVGMSLLLTAAFMPWFYTTPTLSAFLWMAGAGISGVVAQLLVTRGFALAQASFLSPFAYVSIIYATIFGWFIWGQWPTHSTIVGALIVMVAAFMTLALERICAKSTATLTQS